MSRRSRRWDTWVQRQCRDHERWPKDCMGRHERWWELGQERLAWEASVRERGLTPEQAQREAESCPF